MTHHCTHDDDDDELLTFINELYNQLQPSISHWLTHTHTAYIMSTKTLCFQVWCSMSDIQSNVRCELCFHIMAQTYALKHFITVSVLMQMKLKSSTWHSLQTHAILRKKTYRRVPSTPFPSLSSLFPSGTSPLPSPIFQLGLGSDVSPLARSGAKPHLKSTLVQFSLKIWHLVATNVMMSLKINCPNFISSQAEYVKWFLRDTIWYFEMHRFNNTPSTHYIEHVYTIAATLCRRRLQTAV